MNGGFRTKIGFNQRMNISVTNLGLKSLERLGIGVFHFLYWEVSGVRVMHD
jgi:hypothetical protein